MRWSLKIHEGVKMKFKDPSVLLILAIIPSILINLSSCKKIDLDKQILDIKIKAITSIELSSMTFNELPSLFFLYENLVTKRFESVHKNDRRKFEEFMKVHQYHAINSTFYSLKFRDVIMSIEYFDARELDIMTKSVNWTDNDVTKYGFLSKKDGKFKFPEQAFADFFIAQYFHDNIIHPRGNPTDDEMELRLRFLFYITTNVLGRYPVANEFIKAMICDQTGEMFSDQVRMLMKYKFNNLLDPYFRQDLKDVEKISRIFEKDGEILGNLWGTDQNQPLFLRYLKYDRLTVKELKTLAEKLFKIESDPQLDTNLTSNFTKPSQKVQAEKIFRGKNQILNVLYKIHEKKNENFTKDILNDTKYEVSDEILTKLSQESSFLDFVDSTDFSLTDKKEFFMTNAYRLIGINWNVENFTQLWNRMDKYFTKNEMKLILTQKDRHFNHTHLFSLPCSSDFAFAETFLNLTRTYLNPEEIKEFMNHRRPLSKASFLTHYLKIADSKKVFELNYNFAKEFSTHEELKSLIFDNKDVPFIQKVARNERIFNFSMNMLSEFCTKDEIQDMLVAVDDSNRNILFWVIDGFSWNPRQDVAEFLRKIFKGQEEKLKIMFKTRETYGRNIFTMFNGSSYAKNAQPFFDLAKEIFDEDEIKKLSEKN